MLLDGYVRVSQVGGRSGPSFVSPAAQRDAIERWAAQDNAVIGQIFEELDESGARSDRPLLVEAIRRVEAGESDGLVVPYLSRFGRSLIDALLLIKRITAAGGTFVSVQEGLDLSTDTGRLVLRMMLSIAEWERDRQRAYFDDARRRAIARGVSVAQAPVGYRRGEDGCLLVDPEAGAVIAELFRRRSNGESLSELQGWLNAEGQRLGRDWRVAASRVVTRRVYRGELRHGRFVNLHAHEPLVDEETWKRAQTRDLRLPPQGTPKPALLKGILRCAGCQRPLRLSRQSVGASREYLSYQCQDNGRPRCDHPAKIGDTAVEPYVEALFWQELPRLLRGRASGSRRLELDLERRERELVAYRDNPRLPRTLGDDRFAAGLEVRLRRVELARRALSQRDLRARPPRLPEFTDLASRWPTMSVNERRAAIGEVIDCVYVWRRGKGGASLAERLFVCLRGRGPSPVRYRGGDRDVAVAFDPRSCAPGPTLTAVNRDVDTATLRRELEAFLDGQRFWPAFRYFQERGRTDLYSDITASGGVRRWARELGLRMQPRAQVRLNWPEQKIRRELHRYLRGKTRWPTIAEFRAAGLGELRLAITWRGGPERWAAEMGLRVKVNQRRTHRWSYADMRDAIRKLAGDSGHWPTHRTLESVPGLEWATRRRDVRAQLCNDLALAPPTRSPVRTRYWTDEQIQDALDQLLAGRDTWPTRRMFGAAGLLGLHEALRRRGIRDDWAERYGFEAPRHRSRTPARRLTSGDPSG